MVGIRRGWRLVRKGWSLLASDKPDDYFLMEEYYAPTIITDFPNCMTQKQTLLKTSLSSWGVYFSALQTRVIPKKCFFLAFLWNLKLFMDTNTHTWALPQIYHTNLWALQINNHCFHLRLTKSEMCVVPNKLIILWGWLLDIAKY